jgi:NAD-dependent deacetylase
MKEDGGVSPDALKQAADAISRARRLTSLTGAGVSAASGIPTFRGADGLWKKLRAETLATPEAFENDPKLVWEWYDWRRGMIRDAQPNAAHHVLAAWTRERRLSLITQNVDGLHERAGAEGVIRLHGSIWHVRCWNACASGRTDWLDDTVPLANLPPRCPHCHGFVRPGVVWFGEGLDPGVLSRATAAAAACDVFLTIGTSAVVYPAAGLVPHAKRSGALVVEINPDSTGATNIADIVIRQPAHEALALINGLL